LRRHPKVSVLILNYNGLKWLPICLSSVAETDYPNLEIYLIDNGSADGSVDYVQRNHPQVKIILNGENLGFAGGYNRAVERVDGEFIILLNNDTKVLEPKWIRHLVDEALKDPDVAAVACKLVSMDDPSRLDSVGGMGIPYWRGFVDVGRGERDRGQYDHGGFEPFAFCGGAALVKRDVFAKLDGFDEKFFLYFEDADLSWRLRLSGYKVSYAPQARVAHRSSGTTELAIAEDKRLYLCHRNLLRAILKNCGSSLTWAIRNYLFYTLLMAAGFALLEPKKALAALMALLWNLTVLRDTYDRRLRIQASRKVEETEILEKMYAGLRRYQPPGRAKLRRILDDLFERLDRGSGLPRR
jgi:GT2 family glycosyltransferase